MPPVKEKVIQHRVLYVKKNRSQWQPIFSVEPDNSLANELILAKKIEVINDCNRGGACQPEFKDVIEHEGREI